MAVTSVIIGTVRQGRFSEKPARWILDHLKKREGVDARLLALKDHPMPFYDRRPAVVDQSAEDRAGKLTMLCGKAFATGFANLDSAAQS